MILEHYNKGLSGMHPDNFDEAMQDAMHTGPPELLSWERPALRKLLANDAEEPEQQLTGADSPQNRMS
jgi:hypothetical protein